MNILKILFPRLFGLSILKFKSLSFESSLAKIDKYKDEYSKLGFNCIYIKNKNFNYNKMNEEGLITSECEGCNVVMIFEKDNK